MKQVKLLPERVHSAVFTLADNLPGVRLLAVRCRSGCCFQTGSSSAGAPVIVSKSQLINFQNVAFCRKKQKTKHFSAVFKEGNICVCVSTFELLGNVSVKYLSTFNRYGWSTWRWKKKRIMMEYHVCFLLRTLWAFYLEMYFFYYS